MKFECIASALNLRNAPKGEVLGELRYGDLFEVSGSAVNAEWVSGTVLSGIHLGRSGYVRRKWLIQYFNQVPTISSLDRAQAASIVATKTQQFNSIRYDLGSKAKDWDALEKNGYVDCSGWVYLLAREIIGAYGLSTKPNLFYTYSDEQITNGGGKTGNIISGKYLNKGLFQAGTIIGIDFAEYSWDRGRPLDIDHIAIAGEDSEGLFISQSSSSGGGVNRVSLDKWCTSQDALIRNGRVHLVDLLSLP